MKLFQKKKNNKGFSLVELIVVVAIMAVLIGVLVPTLIKNVEKSRLSKDKTALDEIKNAIEVALADEKYMDVKTADAGVQLNSGATVNVSTSSGISGMATGTTEADFWKEVQSNLGNKTSITLGSKLKASSTKVMLKIKNGQVSIEVSASGEGGDYDFKVGN